MARTANLMRAQFVDAWTGETYYIEEDDEVTEVSGGYQVSTKVYDTDCGWVDVTTSKPDVGRLRQRDVPAPGHSKVEGADGSTAEVNFVDCNSFTVTVNGVSRIAELGTIQATLRQTGQNRYTEGAGWPSSGHHHPGGFVYLNHPSLRPGRVRGAVS